jgi:HK97 family phage prohead protease
VFDRGDRGGDIIRKGAFARALERSGEVPLLWQHKAGAVIGRVEQLREDARGLRVIAAVQDVRAARLLGGGKVDGLSFAYRVREAKSSGGLRELIELELVEVSLVANPMQPMARVHAVETGYRASGVRSATRDAKRLKCGSAVARSTHVISASL